MTQDELDDFLFMRTPPRVPLARERLKVELALKAQWDSEVAEMKRRFPSWKPDPEDRPVISPGALYELVCSERWAEIDALPLGEITRRVHELQNGRFAKAVEENDYLGVLDPELTIQANLKERMKEARTA